MISLERIKQDKYEIVIGIETHVELLTKTKIFCNCSTQFGGKPNSQCCPICTGMPGALPMLNEKVLEKAIKLAIALNCKVSNISRFDRKNYSYPDLPKSYQISQLYMPIGRNGYLEINNINKNRIGIHEIHMEEDAGKLIHEDVNTLIDYNRAGVPLIEIVSEPDISSSKEAVEYLEQLRYLLIDLGISDCKMQEGSFRADINLSVREIESEKLGIRTEMKNLNSFKAVEDAIEYESNRQIAVIENGGSIIQETRRWDDNLKKSISMRVKEESNDYRYFPDPDLPPIIISETFINNIESNLPELRDEKINRYCNTWGIPLCEAEIIVSEKNLAKLFEETVKITNMAKEVSNWIIMDTMRVLKDKKIHINDIKLRPENLAKLIIMIKDGKINSTIAKEVFDAIFDTNLDPVVYVKENDLIIVENKEILREKINAIIEENPQSVEDYKNGKKKVITYLIGKTMKVMAGQADPKKTSEIIKEILEQL
ncbi:MAG TPA: Asp-tRNA(Asn)/Glu-tRNA(Gln) amidotransferase subunit GatB [Clostridiales bacterium]|nr:Asp-tRNA(Asn)/Glu-tRNA(Gln) amidotransferase subunit GatB [Clostridiales bacterium]